MGPISQAEAQIAARWLRNQADASKKLLERHRAQVVGRPEALTAEAARHATQAGDLQTAYHNASAQVLGLAQSWKGDHYDSFAREGRERLAKLGGVIRGLGRERQHLLRIAEMLRRSASAFDTLIAQLEAKAQEHIGRTSVQRYPYLASALSHDLQRSLREGQNIKAALARVLNERPDFFPQRTLLAQLLRYETPSTGTLPQPRPQNPEGEFDEAVNLLLNRIRADATKPAMQELRDSQQAIRLREALRLPTVDADVAQARTVGRLFFSGGPLDTKPEFLQHFGMPARNDLFTPIPPDVGTIGGQPAVMGFDLLGNIHYGYLNAAAGVSPLTSDYGAMGADLAFNPRGIDWADALAVQIGRELYERYPDPAQLRPEHIREALTRNFERFFEYGGFNPR